MFTNASGQDYSVKPGIKLQPIETGTKSVNRLRIDRRLAGSRRPAPVAG